MLEGENIMWVTKSLWAFYIYVYICTMILSNNVFLWFFRQNDVAFASHPSSCLANTKFGSQELVKTWTDRSFTGPRVWGHVKMTRLLPRFFLWRWVRFDRKKKVGEQDFVPQKFLTKGTKVQTPEKPLKLMGWNGEHLSFLGAWHLFRWGDDRWYTQLLFMAVF